MSALSYLGTYSSKKTVSTYKTALISFFKNVYGERDLTLAERYISEDRDHKKDLQKFLGSMNGRPPKTIRTYLSVVKVFMIENGIEFSQRDWRHLVRRINGTMARTMDKVPSKEELRRIFSHMPLNGKALYLTLASSGMRIGEALQLELDDVDLNRDSVRISIRGEYTKGGDPRIAFISKEAKECISEWLKVRKQYLESASNRSTRYEKSTDDNRLFPFHFSTARFMLVRALEKSGFDERDKSTNIYKIHPHSLRKFFRTEMGTVIPVDIVEALMGHKGYLTQVYRRYSVDQLAEFYKKGETEITIFGKVEEMKEVRRDVRRLEAIIHDQRNTIHNLVKSLDLLEDRLASLEQQREIEQEMKNLPEVSKEEILRAKEALSKK